MSPRFNWEAEAKFCLTALAIEWCKARARAYRWQEEVQLLVEEMSRVTTFYQWQQKRWLERILEYSQTNVSLTHSSQIGEGVKAYAYRQADVSRRMRELCESTWKDVPNLLLQARNRIDEVQCAWDKIPEWVRKHVEEKDLSEEEE
jgi:hypothetical protein